MKKKPPTRFMQTTENYTPLKIASPENILIIQKTKIMKHEKMTKTIIFTEEDKFFKIKPEAHAIYMAVLWNRFSVILLTYRHNTYYEVSRHCQSYELAVDQFDIRYIKKIGDQIKA